MKEGLLVLLCCSCVSFSRSQLICFTNPSLEGTSAPAQLPPGWTTCFSTGSPGDTQPGQWSITQPASNGNTYVSLLCFGENPGGYREGFHQQLSSPLVAGQNYSFTVDLAHSNIYQSVPPNGCYSSLAVYGGNSPCAVTQVLWTSGPFLHTNWQQYTVSFTPTGNWNYITFAPYYINQCGTTTSDYINLLIDNISCIQPQSGASYTPVTCNGSCDGTLTFFPTTGTPPYTYNWVPGNFTTQNVSNICAGTYTCTVTDANGNTVTDIVTVPQPPILNGTTSGNNLNCFGAGNGSANIVASGGVPSYTYSWNTGATTSFINNLQAGTYTCVVTDANGCTITRTVTITSPPSFIASSSPDTGICTGSVTLFVSTTPGTYSYSWAPASGNSSTLTVSPTATTTYTVYVSNMSSCTQTETITVSVSPAPPVPSVTYQNGILTCLSPGYMYQWFLNGNPIPGATQQTYTPLVNGTYYVTITDSMGGCSAMSFPGTVYDIAGLSEPDNIYYSSVYPNPGSGIFNLDFYCTGPVRIRIVNVLGEIVYEEKTEDNTGKVNRKLDISANAKGIYYLQLLSEKGTATHKIKLN